MMNEPLSNFAFNFNVRRYTAGTDSAIVGDPVSLTALTGGFRSIAFDSFGTLRAGAYTRPLFSSTSALSGG